MQPRRHLLLLLSRLPLLPLAFLLGSLTLTPQQLHAAARKPKLSLGFHVEVKASGPDPFSVQVRLQKPSRILTIERAASLSERHVSAIHLYPADDDTWGCLFKLNDSGRIILSNLSSANRGRSLVFFFASATVNRPVLDLLIDTTIEDGFINIPRGLSPQEARLLKDQFPQTITPKKAP
jgi:hypothetical protein